MKTYFKGVGRKYGEAEIKRDVVLSAWKNYCREDQRKHHSKGVIEIVFPYINDIISEILGEFDIMVGDVSPELDTEYREAYDKLSNCIYRQIIENNGLFKLLSKK